MYGVSTMSDRVTNHRGHSAISMQVYVEIDQFRALLNRYKTDGKYQCVHPATKANSAI